MHAQIKMNSGHWICLACFSGVVSFPELVFHIFFFPPVQIRPPAGLFHPLGVIRELLESSMTFYTFDAVKMIVPSAYTGM